MLPGTTPQSFIKDLSSRLSQLEEIASGRRPASLICLGKLFQPEAYITATRQTVAHENGWSLEQLAMRLEFGDGDGGSRFGIEGK